MHCEEPGELVAKALGGLVLLCVAYNAVVMLCRPAESPRRRSPAAHARQKSSLKTAGGGANARPRSTGKRISIVEASEAAPVRTTAPERTPPPPRSPFFAVAAKPADGGAQKRSSQPSPAPKRAPPAPLPPPKRPPPAPLPPPLPAELFVLGEEENAKGMPALLLLRPRSPPEEEAGALDVQLYQAQSVRGGPKERAKEEGRGTRARKRTE